MVYDTIPTMKPRLSFFLPLGLVAALVNVLISAEPGSVVVDAESGRHWQADWRWIEHQMPPAHEHIAHEVE